MPKLSIVVPTRERSDTLRHTIRTLVDQEYADCEILVSDNASTDRTQQVVESFSDSRLRYINTEKRVSMSENWEFALGKARGDFVTYIGDDDGFIPGAIAKAMTLVEKTQTNALVWNKAEYTWPDHISENYRNRFSVSACSGTLQRADGQKHLIKVMKFYESYTRLPCLYNGIIRKALLNRVIESSANGVFFNSISPDVYSSIALSTVVDKYLLADYPFSVNGASRHSNGTSTMLQQTGAQSPSAIFRSESSRTYDERIQMGPHPAIILMGEYLLARQFSPNLNFFEPLWDRYVRLLVRYGTVAGVPEVLSSAAHTARSVGIRIKIPDIVAPLESAASNLGFHGNALAFTAPVRMVSNIYDACQLIAGMLPPLIGGDIRSPIGRFVTKTIASFISEAKNLNRSL